MGHLNIIKKCFQLRSLYLDTFRMVSNRCSHSAAKQILDIVYISLIYIYIYLFIYLNTEPLLETSRFEVIYLFSNPSVFRNIFVTWQHS